MLDDLRRLPRVSVCCRAEVHDRYGMWTAITDDLGERGCQLVSARLLRIGTTLRLTISSDLFPEELEAGARVAWSTPDRIGVVFEPATRPGALTPKQFLEKVIEHGQLVDTGSAGCVAPSVQRDPGRVRSRRLVRTG